MRVGVIAVYLERSPEDTIERWIKNEKRTYISGMLDVCRFWKLCLF